LDLSNHLSGESDDAPSLVILCTIFFYLSSDSVFISMAFHIQIWSFTNVTRITVQDLLLKSKLNNWHS